MKKRFLYLFFFVFSFSYPVQAGLSSEDFIMTVTGKVAAEEMGRSLIHEHLLVDFIGATLTGPGRWDRDEVANRVGPFLYPVKEHGVTTLVECTPSYIGKDAALMKRLSEESGIQILTNTGYYGAVDNKFLPPHAFEESADELAARWTADFHDGIDDTGIRPGFMKIGVDSGPLSAIHAKLVRAAARTHLATGLTIASHTGDPTAAMEQIALLKEEGAHPAAFIWVHAQGSDRLKEHIKAARMGAWISLDAVHRDRIPDYVAMLENLRMAGLLHRALISHDAGWYSAGEPNGGDFRPFTDIFTHLLPALEGAGFAPEEIEQLLVTNPGRAFAVRKRPLD